MQMFKNKITGSIMTSEEMMDDLLDIYLEQKINANYKEWLLRTIDEDYEEIHPE